MALDVVYPPTQRSPTMRIARILIIASVLGVLTTVAIAWGLAAWLPQKDWDERHTHGRGESRTMYFVSVTEYRTSGAVRRDWCVPDIRDIRSNIIYMPFVFSIENKRDDSEWNLGPLRGGAWGTAQEKLDNPAALSPSQAGCEHATGWPLLAGWYGLSITHPGPIMLEGGIPIRGIGTSPRTKTSDIRALPLHPIWRGIIVNSLFYATVWAGLFVGIGMVRRALRRRAGRCTRCAYDLRGLPAGTRCPECGTA
ncbi:MAG: hypothetical protein H7210_08250, partial [Pyrinomonadaceae bacterium]|nr:hypothetical protein [Phycisphaerales bacterium]